ncbi:CLUMA_CG001225, isoform A [Clunio marinus]|uniref:CLUMA_CG001225, isoform A n=1 Tax=Clunio marinus TaxID=568069 RepID=A0A1J1HHC1_9DIPT|nr:CLUMA_CG001225, isoform A [Clunio marinus]
MKLKTLLVTILVLIFVKYSDQAVKFLNCVILINPFKIRVNKVEETHNEYMLDFKHSLRITQNFTSYISFNLTLLVKLDSMYFYYSIFLPNSNGKMVPFSKRTGMNLCNFFKDQKRKTKLLQSFFKNNNSSSKRVMESCPVEPGFYFIKDYNVVERLMPYAITEIKIVIVAEIKTKIKGEMVNLGTLKIHYEVEALEIVNIE